MVEGAVRLLATRGVEGTSFAEVLEATDSPRGSVYHHFPGGKPELLHAALDLASERGLAAMEATRGQPSAVVIERFLSLWRGLLEYSRLTAGCAVVAVTVAATTKVSSSTPAPSFGPGRSSSPISVWPAAWRWNAARPLAVTVIAATEGAVAICRAERSMEPFEHVENVLLALVDSVNAQPGGDGPGSRSDEQGERTAT